MSVTNEQPQPTKISRGRTGPRTAEGKKRSSLNSVAHGCRAARHCILPGERQEDYEALRQYWFDIYQPVNTREAQLVTAIAEAEWLKGRCDRLLAKFTLEQARIARYQREATARVKAMRRAYDVAVHS